MIYHVNRFLHFVVPSIFHMLPEAEFVHGNGKVTGLVVTVVEVPVVHRDQVHITENEAVVFCVFESFCVANIKQLGPIKGVLTKLKHNRKKNYNNSSIDPIELSGKKT